MAGKKQTTTVSNKVKIECIMCGKEKNVREFYSSNKGEHIALHGKAPYCKTCVAKDMIVDKDTGQISREGFINFLSKVDRPFIPDIYKEIVTTSTVTNLVSNYINRLNLKGYNDLIYIDTERFGEVINANKENKNSSDFSKIDVEITQEDLEVQKDVIKLLGYDPFAGYEKLDKKVMYGELLPYLDEETLEDQFKISVIIQIVNNNNQIRKIDLVINKLSLDINLLMKNSKDIDQLTATKNKLTQSNDRLSKENSIALKHRGDKKAGKSTLGAMMKQLRELNFEDAEEDFYDMQTAYGMKQVADISNKSILEQLNFDEKDVDDMLKMQRDYIQKLQNEKIDLEEKLRQANEKIINLEQNILKEGDLVNEE